MTYPTHDIYRAAYLLARGFRLVTVSPDHEENRVAFIFENNDGGARDAVLALTNNEPIGSQSFVTALRSIKGAMRAAKDGQ